MAGKLTAQLHNAFGLKPAWALPALLVQSCAGQFQVTGGELIGIDSGNSGATCPAGTYSISSPVEQYCPPCPTGYTCTGGAKTTCGYGEQGRSVAGRLGSPFCAALSACQPCPVHQPPADGTLHLPCRQVQQLPGQV